MKRKIVKEILFCLLALAILAGVMAASEKAVTSEVVRDSIKEYNAALETGDMASVCIHAGLVKEACIQAHDEACAKEWAEIEKADCGGF